MEWYIMAFVAIVGWIFQDYNVKRQQSKEFNQQKELLEDEQAFTAEREDIAYERSKPETQLQNLLDAGFNPNLAAQSVLGGNGESVTASGSPSAPTTNSAIQALQSAFGGSQQQLYDVMRNVAEIRNINANTNRTEIEAGLMPRDFILRQLTAEEQIKYWDKSIEKMSTEIDINKEAVELAKQQNLYYGRVMESEIKEREAVAFQAIANAVNALEQAKTEENRRRNIDADTSLKHAETDKAIAEKDLIWTEQSSEYYRSERERIALQFEKDCGGVPLTADAQKYVNKLAREGKYDEIKQFYQLIFTGALSQGVGETLSKPKFKFKIPWVMDYEGQNNSLNTLYNNPYFNPQMRK